ncbi:EF-hand calcium-binding domain-containing protein 4A-like isoform X2 [Homalodisca vitripennis]|uniref:EF-hand calcium-binding domain-containing protein 4A-like isoform X2 n=1 Tax=Homalodisca vitripennis TaxID=197043 RepID=UPI001EEBD46B|nr:EF-hand calcium-binding domain-containing protein 4A-like isoform X2 [Homalodisca vitripennis]
MLVCALTQGGMEDIAVQLFKLGDREHKGFIVKRDMQRLQSEVSLPPDQLEAVFESLDSSHNGYLTLDQFLAGVSQYTTLHDHFGSDGETDSRSDSESDVPIQRLLSLNVLHKSGELMCEVRGLVGSEDTWHQLLAALFSDLNQLLRQISQLEDTLRARDHRHQEERLYEELESQLTEERDRLHKQLCQKEAVLRTELTAELAAKEQQIAELTEQRDELQERLRIAHSQLSSSLRRPSQGKTQDGPGRESGQSQQSQDCIRHRAEMRAERSYAEGFSHAHQLATLHEEGLVKQLRLLQEMRENLRSGQKEEKQRMFSYDDL